MYELWIADEVYSAILQSFQNTAAFICENMNGCTMMWSNKNVVMLCIGAPPVVSSEIVQKRFRSNWFKVNKWQSFLKSHLSSTTFLRCSAIHFLCVCLFFLNLFRWLLQSLIWSNGCYQGWWQGEHTCQLSVEAGHIEGVYIQRCCWYWFTWETGNWHWTQVMI